MFLAVFFATDQLHSPPRCAEIQRVSQQFKTLPQLVRITGWYSIHALLQHAPDAVIYRVEVRTVGLPHVRTCLLYTSDAADDLTRVDLGGRRIIKKKK